MIKKIKNIFNLTKIISKNSLQNPYLIDKKTNKINKNSPYIWIVIIVMVAIMFVSYKAIGELVKINKEYIFLNIFFLILMLIMIFQIILSSTNIYFFSNDLERLLPLPIKTEELLISKFNTILINLYFSEFIFALFPLIIYGVETYASFNYYFNLIIVLLIFPFLPTLIISIIMMFFIKLSKFIKNKDIFQILITLLFIFIIFIFEFNVMKNIINKMDNNEELEKQQVEEAFIKFNNKIEIVNDYFIEINPTIKILQNNKIIFNLLKYIWIDFIFFILFILIGKKYYLKNILNNINNCYLKNNKKIKINKKNKIIKSYIGKEFKILFKNSTFFIQCVFPILITIITIVIIVIVTYSNLRMFLTSELYNTEFKISVDLSVICLILGFLQLLSTMFSISATSISREGKDAVYMKSIPVSLYEQYICKGIPQILINIIVNIVILALIKILFFEINFEYLFVTFLISILLSIINSQVMVLVNLINPNINWNSEYDATRQKTNKLFQYVLTIIIILILVYFNDFFSDTNLNIACYLIFFILLICILIINFIVKLNIKKIFKKIN